MSPVAARRPLSEGLQSAMASATGRPCGLMQWDVNYVNAEILENLPGMTIEPLADPRHIRAWGSDFREAEFPYAFHSYAIDKRSCEAMADLAQLRFLDRTWTVAGYDIIDTRPDSAGERGEVEKVATELYYVRENFILHVASV